MNNLVIGVDIAKRVFQLHWAEESGEIKSVQLRREKFLEHFANRGAMFGRHGSVRRLTTLGTRATETRPRGEHVLSGLQCNSRASRA